jgi:uncharacterized protein involved in outer membrane biogenesis
LARKLSRSLKFALLASAALLLLVLFGVLPVNLFFAKSAIAETVRQTLGAELEIQGQLSLRLGFRARLSASDIVLHSPVRDEPPLARLEHLRVDPRLFDLLKGDIRLRGITVSGAAVNYCPESLPAMKGTDGQTAPSDDTSPFSIDQLQLERLALQCDRPDARLAPLPEMVDVTASAPRGQAVNVRVSGQLGAEEMVLEATGGSLDVLSSDAREYPLRLNLSALQSSLMVDAVFHRPTGTPSLNSPVMTAGLELDSDEPAALLRAVGLEFPPTGPLTLVAESQVWPGGIRIRSLDGSLGGNRFGLSGRLDGLDTRPYLELEASLSQLDAALLQSGSNGDVGSDGWKDYSFEQSFEFLRLFDARVGIRVDRLDNTVISARELVLNASVDRGQILIEQARVILEQSPTDAKASLDLNSDCPELIVEAQIELFDLQTLDRLSDDSVALAGEIEKISARTISCGNTPGQHIESLQLSGLFKQANPVYGKAGEEPFDALSIGSLQVELAQARSGHLVFDGKVFGEQLSAQVGLGSLTNMLGTAPWPLHLQAQAAGAELELDGRASYDGGFPGFSGRLNAEVSRLGGLHAWIGSDPGNRSSATLSSDIQLQRDAWSFDSLLVQLPKSDLRGSLFALRGAAGPEFELTLKSGLLDLNELSGIFPDNGSEKPADKNRRPIRDRFAFPSIEFDLSANRIAGLNASVEAVSLEGKIADDLIEDSRMSLTIEDIGITGTVNADLRQAPWRFDYGFTADELDIGRLLSTLGLAQDVNAQAGHMDFDFSSEGGTIQEWMANARLESRIESFSWTGKAIPGEENPNVLELSHATILISPSSETQWSAAGVFNDVPLSFWMLSPSMATTLEASSDLPLHLVLNSGNDLAMLDLVVKRGAGKPLEIDLSASGQKKSEKPVSLARLQGPLQQYEFGTRLSLSQDEWRLDDFHARVGNSSMAGHMAIESQGERYHFGLQLHAPWLETEDFVELADNWRQVDQEEKVAENHGSQDEGPRQGLLQIVNSTLDDLSQIASIDMELTVDELYSAGNFLGTAELSLVADESEFRLDPVRIALPGGDVEATYTGRTTDDGVSANLDIYVEKLEYGGLLRLLDSESEAQGLMYLDASLRSTAPQWQSLDTGVEGMLDLVLIPEDIQAGFLDIWASNLVLALLPIGSNSSKKMNCMVARFEAESGVLKTKNWLLDSTDIIVRGRGEIDLAGRELDLLFAPQAKLEKFLSVSAPIAVTGPFNDFQVGLAHGGFVMTLFRWYLNLIYVPFKWLTGERFPADGIATCFSAMDWSAPPQRAK